MLLFTFDSSGLTPIPVESGNEPFPSAYVTCFGNRYSDCKLDEDIATFSFMVGT